MPLQSEDLGPAPRPESTFDAVARVVYNTVAKQQQHRQYLASLAISPLPTHLLTAASSSSNNNNNSSSDPDGGSGGGTRGARMSAAAATATGTTPTHDAIAAASSSSMLASTAAGAATTPAGTGLAIGMSLSPGVGSGVGARTCGRYPAYASIVSQFPRGAVPVAVLVDAMVQQVDVMVRERREAAAAAAAEASRPVSATQGASCSTL